MNARIAGMLVWMALVLAACAPAAAPTPIAIEPRVEVRQPEPEYELALPTQAATQPLMPTLAAGAPNNGADNYFQDYGVNPRTDANRDNLSTFAVDVDTASYAVARRYINEGSLPPMDAVRAEEFVNAFEQGYRTPREAAFALYADGAPSPFTRQGTYLVRFGIQGYRVPDDLRKPLRLVFVIDISGSMDMENRLETVKDALRMLVKQLREDDMVAVIVYGSQAHVALEWTPGSHHRSILSAIDRLRTEGATNAEAGLRLGYRYAIREVNPEYNTRVILCSDGVANVGNTGPDAILDYVGGYVDEGISLTTVGFGMGNFNDVLMEQLANRGDGNYYYVDTLEEARRIFVDQLTSTVQTIAYDAKVQVDFDPEVVENYRLIGYENREVADEDFRNDAVDAGEIGAGHAVAALYEVSLFPGAEGRIASLHLRWQDAETRDVREIAGDFYTWDLASRFDEADLRFQLAATVGAFAEVLRFSPYVESDLSQVAMEARRLARLLDEDEQVVEFAELTLRAARIR